MSEKSRRPLGSRRPPNARNLGGRRVPAAHPTRGAPSPHLSRRRALSTRPSLLVFLITIILILLISIGIATLGMFISWCCYQVFWFVSQSSDINPDVWWAVSCFCSWVTLSLIKYHLIYVCMYLSIYLFIWPEGSSIHV